MAVWARNKTKKELNKISISKTPEKWDTINNCLVVIMTGDRMTNNN